MAGDICRTKRQPVGGGLTRAVRAGFRLIQMALDKGGVSGTGGNHAGTQVKLAGDGHGVGGGFGVGGQAMPRGDEA